jgi:NAD-dependent SIR2 family protein deacetylase
LEANKVKDNPNKIWVVVNPIRGRNPEYCEYNSVSEALSDFDDWTLDTESIARCDVIYRGVTMLHSSKGKVSGAACEQYNQDCSIRSKLPNSREIPNCEECVKKMMVAYA